jgi:hypothetical protein
MPRNTPGQARIPGTSVPKRVGRVRTAAGREVHDARARGVEVSPLSATSVYVLADKIDAIESTGDDTYLLGQLFTRLLEERRAANLLPERTEAADDIWAAFSADIAAMGDAPQPVEPDDR